LTDFSTLLKFLGNKELFGVNHLHRHSAVNDEVNAWGYNTPYKSIFPKKPTF